MARTLIGNIGGGILPSGKAYVDVPTQRDLAMVEEKGYEGNGVYVDRSKGMFIKNSDDGNLFEAMSMGVRYHLNDAPDNTLWLRSSWVGPWDFLLEMKSYCNSDGYNFVRFYPSISVTGDGYCDVYYNFLVNNHHRGFRVDTIYESKDAFTIEGCVLFIGGVTEAKEPTDELLGLLWTEWAENATNASHADTARIITPSNKMSDGGVDLHHHGLYCITVDVTVGKRTGRANINVAIPKGWDGSAFETPLSAALIEKEDGVEWAKHQYLVFATIENYGIKDVCYITMADGIIADTVARVSSYSIVECSCIQFS